MSKPKKIGLQTKVVVRSLEETAFSNSCIERGLNIDIQIDIRERFNRILNSSKNFYRQVI